MKIGILTYHRSVNDGAVLQAYCVHKIFKELFPAAEIEIIDYRPWRMEFMELKRLVTVRRLKINFDQIRKYSVVRSFLKNQGIKFSNKSFTSDNTYKSIEFIANQKYDLIVCGSDTIWEMRDDGNVPAPPNVFFLPGLKNVKKIAFAASSDPVNLEHPFIETLKPSNNGVKDAISNFDLVYVRDSATKDLIKNTIGIEENIYRIPDPSLLCDFDEIVEDSNLSKDNNNKVASIALSSDKLRSRFTKLFKNKGYKVFNLLGTSVEGQIQLKGNTVEERMANLKLHDILITDRFHGSILSFKLNHKPVIFIEDSTKWHDRNSKGRDLFESLGFEEFVVRTKGDFNLEMDKIDKLIDKWGIQKELIPKRLEELRSKSLKKLELIKETL